MKLAVFSSKPYDEQFLTAANEEYGHELSFLEPRLTQATNALAQGYEAVCAFVNDELNADVLEQLKRGGTELVALRCAGFNNVDVRAAHKLELSVARVPAYSPYAVAEHAVALMLGLNRQLHRAYNRVREANFSLSGLVGFDLHGKTVGVVGTGKIGQVLCHIMNGFGCDVLAYDPYPSDALQGAVQYVSLERLLGSSDIISLHCPLTPDTHHLISADTLAKTKPGVMLINTSRGGLIDTSAVIAALKRGQLGYLGLDVYEEEADLFFEDLSGRVLQDDLFSRLLTFPNVLITGHQGFFTKEALKRIAATTLANVSAFESGSGELFEVTPKMLA